MENSYYFRTAFHCILLHTSRNLVGCTYHEYKVLHKKLRKR